MKENYTKYLLTLQLIPGVGRKTIQKIYTNSLSIENKLEYINNTITNLIKDDKDINYYMDKSISIINNSTKDKIKIINIYEDCFPKSLKRIEDFPILIHVKGNHKILEEKSIAIIGTREPTEHAIKVTERLSDIVVAKGYNIVSGLAIGCDRIAQSRCVDIGGKTIAIMPGGLDEVYPKSSKDLADKIIETGGCLLSEYYYGIKPFKGNYVERDRLQSGLSNGLIVVETKTDGGSMHAIRSSLESKKVVGAYYNKNYYSKTDSIKNISGNIFLIESNKAIPLDGTDNIELFFERLVKEKINVNQESTQISMDNLNRNSFKKGIIFDLDQTLIDTKNVKSLRDSRQWKRVFEEIERGKISPYDGVLELIKDLQNNKVDIAIVTNSPRNYCEEIVKKFNLNITNLVCYHDVKKRKPDKEPMLKAINNMEVNTENILSIGDDIRDIVSANSANIISIAALWDSVDIEEDLRKANANYYCEDIIQLRKLLVKLEYI